MKDFHCTQKSFLRKKRLGHVKPIPMFFELLFIPFFENVSDTLHDNFIVTADYCVFDHTSLYPLDNSNLIPLPLSINWTIARLNFATIR